MTVRASGTNSPLRRRTSKALARRAELVAKYVAEGMDEEAATERAQREMRENDKGDWRRG